MRSKGGPNRYKPSSMRDTLVAYCRGGNLKYRKICKKAEMEKCNFLFRRITDVCQKPFLLEEFCFEVY